MRDHTADQGRRRKPQSQQFNPPWLIIYQDEANCASCWSRDPETEDPWLCIAGNDGNVKVYDVKRGKLVKVRQTAQDEACSQRWYG